MAVPGDQQAARNLVQEISRSHGYLDPEKFQRIDPDLRSEFEGAFLRKDNLIGSTVITYDCSLLS